MFGLHVFNCAKESQTLIGGTWCVTQGAAPSRHGSVKLVVLCFRFFPTPTSCLKRGKMNACIQLTNYSFNKRFINTAKYFPLFCFLLVMNGSGEVIFYKLVRRTLNALSIYLLLFLFCAIIQLYLLFYRNFPGIIN